MHHLDSVVHHAGEFKLAGSNRVIKSGAVTVGGGTILQKIYEETAKFNETIIGGLSRTVGVGGYVTGGGHSGLSPTYGLAADNILQMEVVTADGKVRTVNQDQDQDLFWALRGVSPCPMFLSFIFPVSIGSMLVMTCQFLQLLPILVHSPRQVSVNGGRMLY